MTPTLASRMTRFRETLLASVALFGSMGTLICCALPTLLVSLGLGSVMAGLASSIPGLIWASEHKGEIFFFAGSMLALNSLVIWRGRNAPCPLEPKLRDACIRGRYTSKIVLFVSLGAFATGAFFAYIAPKLLF